MKIAIKGHKNKGKEVIQVLESLGGINKKGFIGHSDTFYYFINKHKSIEWFSIHHIIDDYKCYTLEEFEKEFPFKIGDTAYFDNHPFVIEGITEHENNPAYRGYLVKLGPAIIETTVLTKMKEERNITLTLDKAKEWYNKGGELKEVALQAFTEKELNPLPRSWEEFCELTKFAFNGSLEYINGIVHCSNGCLPNKSIGKSSEIWDKHLALFQLEQLRDCWRQSWKQGWKPSKRDTGFSIKNAERDLDVYAYYSIEFLSFPTKKMAEEFLECFRDLIEKAGDLI